MPGIKEKKSIPPPTQAQMLKPHHRQVTPHELAPEEDLGQQVEFEKNLNDIQSGKMELDGCQKNFNHEQKLKLISAAIVKNIRALKKANEFYYQDGQAKSKKKKINITPKDKHDYSTMIESTLMNIIREDWEKIFLIPENFITITMWAVAIEKSPRVYRYMQLISEKSEVKNNLELCVKAIENGLPPTEIPAAMLEEVQVYQAILLKNPNMYDSKGFPAKLLPIKSDLLLYALRGGYQLHKVNPELRTPEVCEAAVVFNGRQLEYVPEKLKTDELCLKAVSSDSEAIKYVPHGLRNKNIYLAAIKKNGLLLQKVPKELLDDEMCLVAIKNNKKAFIFVPEELKTGSLKEEFDKYKNELTGSSSLTLSELADEASRNWPIVLSMWTKDGCKELLASATEAEVNKIYINALQNGMSLYDVPAKYRNEELNMAAVKLNGSNLDYIKEKNADLCLTAVMQSWEAIEYVPPELMTKQIRLAALKQDINSLKYIQDLDPNDSDVEDIITIKVMQDPESINLIPDKYKTQAMCKYAVKADRENFKFVPMRFRDDSLCRYVAEVDIIALSTYMTGDEKLENSTIEKIKSHMVHYIKRTENSEHDLLILKAAKKFDKNNAFFDLYLAAVSKNGSLISEITFDNYETAERKRLYLAAFISDENGIDFLRLPEEFKVEILSEAMKLKPFLITKLPIEFQKAELWIKAVKYDAGLFAKVPLKFREAIVANIGVERLLTYDFSYIKLLNEIKNAEITESIQKFLNNVRHVIVSGSEHWDDKEIKESKLVYSQKNSRKQNGETVSVNNIHDFNDIMQRLGKESNVTLVLLDHSNINSTVIGLSADQAATACQKYPQINYIRVIACHSAAADKTSGEESLHDGLRDPGSKKKSQQRALFIEEASFSHLTTPEDINKFIANLIGDKKVEFPVAVLLKDPKENTYKYISIKSKDHYYLHDLDANEQFEKLYAKLKYNISKNKNPNNNQTTISIDELEKVRSCKKHKRFASGHPKYKSDKAKHPFMRTIPVESKHLKQSYLKALQDELSKRVSRHELQQEEIRVQGYTKITHVDYSRQKFVSSNTYAYHDKYQHSIFGADAIEYRKIRSEAEKELHKKGDKTSAKAVEFTVVTHAKKQMKQ